jgi:uncharacterized surface protein with fasciclin (FAS1) repeats
MRLTRAAACRAFAGCLIATTLIAPAAASAPPATVLDLAAQQKNLSTFVVAVHTAGLDDLFRGPGPLTVYAPNDAAFARLPDADRAALMSSPDRLRALILGLVVKDNIVMHDGDVTVTSGSATTAGGRDIAFALDGDRQTVAGAHVVHTDMRAGNGRVDEIDKVVMQ